MDNTMTEDDNDGRHTLNLYYYEGGSWTTGCPNDEGKAQEHIKESYEPIRPLRNVATMNRRTADRAVVPTMGI